MQTKPRAAAQTFLFSRLARSLGPCALVASVALLSSCGKQAFQVTASQESQTAPGGTTVPPKVDILLAEDDTGSMFEDYSTISTQLQSFISSLDSQGWDYHFATIPLTTDRTLSQVVASTQDSNWGTSWTPAYPGAPFNGPGTVSPSVFTELANYTGFIGTSDINLSEGGYQPGYDNILQALKNREPGTGLLRTDSTVALIVLTDGNDTSKVNICNDGYGHQGMCGTATLTIHPPACATGSDINAVYSAGVHYLTNGAYDVCASEAIARTYYQTQLQSLFATRAMYKMYAVAAASTTSSCVNDSQANAGTQYTRVAPSLGGQVYDICTTGLTTVLSDIGQNLAAQRLNYETRYLFISSAPNISTITVTKFSNGVASAGISIPQDSNNGWTYAGDLTNVFAIDAPVPMNVSSGYAIELHGTAKLLGNDTASVSFKPAGVSDSQTP